MRLEEVAIAAVKRELPGFPTATGWCVAFVFECLARYLGTNRWVLYSRLLDSVNADPDRSRWSIDVERAVHLRPSLLVSRKDYNPANKTEYEALLSILKPGDLLFSSRLYDEPPTSPKTAPDIEGHTGIYVGLYQGTPTVAENTRASRGVWFRRKTALRLTPLYNWDTVTTVARWR